MSKIDKQKSDIEFIKYQIAFSTRCNRKIFNIHGVKELFLKETRKVCDSISVDINSILFEDNYVCMSINATSKNSASDIIHKIKYNTSRVIRANIRELGSMPSLWTRENLISTREYKDENLLDAFLEQQNIRRI